MLAAAATNNDQVALALIAVVATSVAALVFVIRQNRYVRSAAEEATAANQAVNNVGPGKHNLYDMVSNIHDDVVELREAQKDFTKRGWHALEPPIDTAIGLTRTISQMQHDHDELHQKLDMVLAELRDHVQWEVEEKYDKRG